MEAFPALSYSILTETYDSIVWYTLRFAERGVDVVRSAADCGKKPQTKQADEESNNNRNGHRPTYTSHTRRSGTAGSRYRCKAIYVASERRVLHTNTRAHTIVHSVAHPLIWQADERGGQAEGVLDRDASLAR